MIVKVKGKKGEGLEYLRQNGLKYLKIASFGLFKRWAADRLYVRWGKNESQMIGVDDRNTQYIPLQCKSLGRVHL